MKRSLTLLLVLIATAVNAADLAIATRHTELRAFYLTPSRANPSPSPKVQWAPSGNFQALHGRAVFRRETETASRPYAREEGNTAAGAGIFLSRDSYEGALNSAPSLHRFAYAHSNPLRYRDPSGRAINLAAAGVGAGIGFALGFGAALIDGASLEDAAWTGAKGAGVGFVGGLTFGASLAVGGTAFAVKSAVVAGGIGLGLNATQQGLAIAAEKQDGFSATQAVFAVGASIAIPGGRQAAQLPNLAKGIATVGVLSGAAAGGTGGQEVLQAATDESLGGRQRVALGALGVLDTGLGLFSVAQGPR